MNRPSVSEFAKAHKLEPEQVPKALLLPYQARWCADRSRIKVCVKSRRIGISWTEAGDSALLAASQRGSNVFYASYEKDMTRTFIEDAADWARAFSFAVSEIEEDVELFRDGDENKAVQIFRIFFNSGYKIEALTSRPRAMRSRQGRIVLDEAAFHDELKELLKAAKASALLSWSKSQGSIHIISTYNGTENDFYEFEQDILKGKESGSRHYIPFRDAVSQGLYKRRCLIQGIKWTKQGEQAWIESILDEFGEDADEELHCIPRQGGAVYFPRILIEKAMEPEIPVLRLAFRDEFAVRSLSDRRREIDQWLHEQVKPLLDRLNPLYKSSFGFDFARSGHLSYLLVGQEQPNLVRRGAFALELRNIPFDQQQQILHYIAKRLPRFVGGAMDATGNGSAIAEWMAERFGVYDPPFNLGRIAQIKLNDPWYGTAFPKYKSGLQDGLVVLPQDSDLLDDHRCVTVVRGIPKVPIEKERKGTDGKKRHGDGAIAGCLWWFASEMDSEVGVPAIATQEFDDWGI